jgi:hypothetical protein
MVARKWGIPVPGLTLRIIAMTGLRTLTHGTGHEMESDLESILNTVPFTIRTLYLVNAPLDEAVVAVALCPHAGQLRKLSVAATFDRTHTGAIIPAVACNLRSLRLDIVDIMRPSMTACTDSMQSEQAIAAHVGDLRQLQALFVWTSGFEFWPDTVRSLKAVIPGVKVDIQVEIN